MPRTARLSLPLSTPIWVLAALLATPPLNGQAAPATGQLEGLDELIEVSEVSLDVLATDEKGQPVLGLSAADFEVYEDGTRVELTGVSWTGSRYADAATSAPAEEIPASRYLIFFFHDASAFAASGPGMLRQQLQAGRDAVHFIENQMAASDWAAIVGYDIELRLHQDFTQDREALVRAIERVASGRKPETFLPSRREARGRGRELEILSRLLDNPEASRKNRNPYEGLKQVASACGYLVGRKILLLYTVGFGMRRGITSLPDPRYYPALETELNDNNVAIYPIDLTPAGWPPLEEDFLQRLADDSGGVYDPNISGFRRPLETIAEANAGYYLLTYRSARKAGEVGYQRVEVRARDPKVRLLSRRGYRYGL